jgi:anti-sigma factor RsiW
MTAARGCDAEVLAAFVDGELDARRHDEVAEHLVGCDACRAVVREQRETKAQLAALPDPQPSDDLYARLTTIAVPGISPQRAAVAVGASGPDAVAIGRPKRRSRRPVHMGRAGAILGSAAASVVIVAGTALLVGGNATPQNGPTIVPSVDQYSSQHAAVLTSLPLTDTLPVPASTATVDAASYVAGGP